MALKIAHLHAENFKKLKVIEVTPEGNVIEIAGNNGEGKTSLLDAIWVALKGRAVAPPQPIRQGEEEAYIELDLGKLRIVRTFKLSGDGDFTDTLRVEDANGLKYPKPQAVLDALMGHIGFDPFAFIQLKPDAQAKQLLQLVPLEVDLEELAGLDKRIYDTRRDVNRDAKAAKARLDSLPPAREIGDTVDVAELEAQLAAAAEVNAGIERRKMNRDAFDTKLEQDKIYLAELHEKIAGLQAQAEATAKDIAEREAKKAAAEPLPVLIDTERLLQQITEARQIEQEVRVQKHRAEVAADYEALAKQSEELTAKLQANDQARKDALAKAKMPVDGLGIEFDDDGAHVMFQGVPLEQASTAEKLRVSTAIAMAANPELRVLRISDGSLLDDNSMAILREMAGEHDFQLWIELVRPNESTGIVLEDGSIRGQDAQPKERAKRKAADPGTTKAPDEDGRTLFERSVLGATPEPEQKAPTQEEWEALSPARRAFFTNKGIKPEGAE
jgi:hypothetical protein